VLHFSLKGNVKRHGGFPNLVVQPAKNCASAIVRDASAASFTVEAYACALKSSPNFPLPQDAQFLFGTKKFKIM
jgi:hypothetical protein